MQARGYEALPSVVKAAVYRDVTLLHRASDSVKNETQGWPNQAPLTGCSRRVQVVTVDGAHGTKSCVDWLMGLGYHRGALPKHWV